MYHLGYTQGVEKRRELCAERPPLLPGYEGILVGRDLLLSQVMRESWWVESSRLPCYSRFTVGLVPPPFL